MESSKTAARHTCLKLEIPEPIFIKGTWFPSHFHLSITDGLHSWVCNATEAEVRDRAAQWDQPVSTYIQLAEQHLGFQNPGSVYKFTDAGDGHKRLSWTFEKEGTKLEWRWKCQPSPDCQKTTTLILDFLMDANIRLSMGKMTEDVKMIHETDNRAAKAALNRGMETESKAVKAVWNRGTLHIFCDICIRAVQMGLRPGTYFSKQGWKYVIGQIERQSGQCFTKKQLKNKWDGIKKDWKIWKSLLDQGSELGWDPKKQTISASDDWWDEKIKAMPAAEKFRNVGIEPDLCLKYDFMFTGSSAWPTSSAVIVDVEDNNDNEMQPDFSIMSTVPVEGNGDMGDDPTFVESLDEMLTGAYIDQDSQLEEQRNGKKKKRVDESGAQSVKKVRKESGGTVKSFHKLDRLMATVESRGSVTSRRRDAEGCSIIEVIDELHSMPEIVKGSGLHVFASEFFLLRTRREMWFAMREPKAKINWLRTMYAKSVSTQ